MTGEILWYAVGRFYKWQDGSLQDVGYFSRLGDWRPFTDMGAEEYGPADALFTFYARRFTARSLTWGSAGSALEASVDARGTFDLFFHPGGAQADFADPESFRSPHPIGRFHRVGHATGVSSDTGTANLFTAQRVPDVGRPFELDGRTHRLRDLIPGALTQMGSGGPPGQARIGAAEIPIRDFVGSAFRVG